MTICGAQERQHSRQFRAPRKRESSPVCPVRWPRIKAARNAWFSHASRSEGRKDRAVGRRVHTATRNEREGEKKMTRFVSRGVHTLRSARIRAARSGSFRETTFEAARCARAIVCAQHRNYNPSSRIFLDYLEA
ncbi:uncharacterized protein LOC143213707 isoform X2 [Lasioglossum baleicum]|uniref:uncharacterized protein LOC143213707 isoform X2 n=1 Tax=Lasioglossum baleicum TaxID=434251 RepID=UPI003FCD8028